MPRETFYEGTTWDELRASRRNPSLWVELKPVGGGKSLFVKVTKLGGFESYGYLWFACLTMVGKPLTMSGTCPHNTNQPVKVKHEA